MDAAKLVTLGIIVAQIIADIMAEYRRTLQKEGGVTEEDLAQWASRRESAVDSWFAGRRGVVVSNDDTTIGGDVSTTTLGEPEPGRDMEVKTGPE